MTLLRIGSVHSFGRDVPAIDLLQPGRFPSAIRAKSRRLKTSPQGLRSKVSENPGSGGSGIPAKKECSDSGNHHHRSYRPVKDSRATAGHELLIGFQGLRNVVVNVRVKNPVAEPMPLTRDCHNLYHSVIIYDRESAR